MRAIAGERLLSLLIREQIHVHLPGFVRAAHKALRDSSTVKSLELSGGLRK
jgi:hypothetical protein